MVPTPEIVDVPVTVPGLLGKAPRMLFDRSQPLFMKWGYIPKLLPWLLRYLKHANADDVNHIAAALTPIVEPDGEWAAWTRGSIEMIQTDPPRWRVPYARDFTFQALNLTNRNRPATDGTYVVVVERQGATLVVVEAPVQVSSQVVQPEWVDHGQCELYSNGSIEGISSTFNDVHTYLGSKRMG